MALSKAAPGGIDARAPSTMLWALTVLVLLVAGHILFAESLVRVAATYRQPEFSHGYVVFLISAWVLWQRHRLIWSIRGAGAASGWLLVAFGTAVAFFAKAANIDSAPYLGLIPLLIGLAAVGLGWPAARLTIVPVGFLVFGFPLPTYTYVEVSTTLQLISSQLGAGILDGFGVPVFLEGNIIDLGVFELQVAEACSGLRYLLPLMSFGALCAFMYRGPWWAKALVVAATVPLAIVLNSARIAMTGLFVHFGSQSLAEGFTHLFEGWVIFLLALAILFVLMYALLRLAGWRGPLRDMLDFDRIAGTPAGRASTPPGGGAAVVPAVAPRPLLAAAATVGLAALLVLPLGMRPQIVPERPGLARFPLELATWTGTPGSVDPEVRAVLRADDTLFVDFVDHAAGGMVNLWVAYYDSQLGDAHIHLPTTCLPGGGWEYVEFGPHRTDFRDFDGEPLIVNRGVISQGDQRIVMYFWMEMRGQSLHLAQNIKFVNLRDSLFFGRSDGALVRLFTPLAEGERPNDGDARLQALLAHVYLRLEPHLGR